MISFTDFSLAVRQKLSSFLVEVILVMQENKSKKINMPNTLLPKFMCINISRVMFSHYIYKGKKALVGPKLNALYI